MRLVSDAQLAILGEVAGQLAAPGGYTEAEGASQSRPHGYARYRLDGCRCYVCGYARSSYDERRIRLIAYGRWQPFVPIEETRERILSLREIGYGDRSIAMLAGVGRKVVRDIRNGYRADPSRGNPPLTKIRTDTAAAIEAIPYDPMGAPDGAYIDATLTWKRIHALIRAGYPRTWIARQLGSTAAHPALQLRTDKVTVRNARGVLDLLRRVGNTPGPSAHARAEGERNGWPTPGDLLDEELRSATPTRRRGLIVSAAEIMAGASS